MQSPFKFLAPYGPEDIEAFFGRDTETQELYSLVTKNRLTFVYGPSGTGKTSLVRCGLSSRFRGGDWLPLFVRRGDDINHSLYKAIGKALNREIRHADEIEAAIQELYKQYFCTIYFIFDQFEELFTLGGEEDGIEREPFYQTIADLLDRQLPARFVFIMREDYFGHLERFERLVPDLYNRKLRVEPMSLDNLRKVIIGSCDVYGIPFGDRASDPDLMLKYITQDRSTVQMTFLQVYLQKLFEEVIYREGLDLGSEYAEVYFDRDAIEQLGSLENALGHFLDDQEKEILEALATHNPPADLVGRVLDVFVTTEGTKIPIAFEQDENGWYHLQGKQAEALNIFPLDMMSDCLAKLERARIIQRQENRLEVIHDTLAHLIDQKRTEEIRQLSEVRRRIEIGYREHVDSHGQYFFDRGQLLRVSPFLNKISISEAWRKFLADSEADCVAKENEERLRAEKERKVLEQKLAAEQAAQEAREEQLRLAKEKLAQEEQAARRQRSLLRIVGSIAIVAVTAVIFAVIKNEEVTQKNVNISQQNKEITQKNREILTQNFRNLLTTGESFRNIGSFEKAIEQLDSAQTIAGEIGQQPQLDSTYSLWRKTFDLIAQADSLQTLGEATWSEALQTFQAAFQLDTSYSVATNRVAALQSNIDEKFERYINAAAGIERILGTKGRGPACAYYQKALALKPKDINTLNKAKACN